MPLVTIDFHNTLFQCDEWFALEIKTLPAAVLRRIRPPEYVGREHQLDVAASTRYREIRVEAMQSGRECDAVTGVCRTLDSLEVTLDRELVNRTVEDIMRGATANAEPVEGAVDLVQSVSKRGIPVAVVSSAAYHPFLEWCLERFHLRSYFQHVVTSASCGIYKSDPGIYSFTLDLFSESPENAVHIGDSHQFDVVSPASIGMQTILFTCQDRHDLQPQPDAIVRSLGDVAPHLDRLLNNRLLD